MFSYLPSYIGETPTLGLRSITLKNGATLNANLPIFGNPQTINGTITIGSATVSRGSYNPATTTSLSVGTNDTPLFGFQVQAGSAENLEMSRVIVYQEGSATLGTDVANMELLQDGTKIADGQVSGNYVIFSNFTSAINAGQQKQYQVRADVVQGASKSIHLDIYNRDDIILKGKTYGYYLVPNYSGAGSGFVSPYLSGNVLFISGGTLIVSRSSSVPAGNITTGSDVTLGAFSFQATGEPVRISGLTMYVASTTSNTTYEDALMAVKLVDSNNNVVAGPTDVWNNSLNITFTDIFTVPVGTSDYRVVGVLRDSGGWSQNDTIYVGINTPSSRIVARGEVTTNTITAQPASNVTANTQTIKTPYLMVTRNTLPASATVIAGSQHVVLASWNLDATNSGEDLYVTAMTWYASSSAATNLTVYDGKYGAGGVAKSPVNIKPVSIGDPRAWASSTFAFSAPIIITKGTTRTVELVGDIEATATTNDSSQFGLTDTSTATNSSVVAYGQNSYNRATTLLVADQGPILTYAHNGSVAVSTYNNPARSLVRAGSTAVTMGNIRITASNEALDLDSLKVYMRNEASVAGTAMGGYQDITAVYLYDGATLLGSTTIPSTGNYTFNFTNGTLTIPKDSSKVLTIKADISTINKDIDNAPGTPGVSIRVGLGGKSGFQFTGVDSNSIISSSSETYNGSTTTSMVIHKAIPTVVYSQPGSPMGVATSLTNGSQDLYKFRVSADGSGNEVLLYRTSFELATGSSGQAITLTGCFLKDATNGNQIISHSAGLNPTDIDGTSKNLISFTFNDPTNPSGASSNYKEAIQIFPGTARDFVLNCTVGSAASGSYVSVALLGDTASSTSADNYGNPSVNSATNQADAFSAYNQGNFVWSDNYKERGLATDGANATAWGQWYNGFLVPGLGELPTSTSYAVSW